MKQLSLLACIDCGIAPPRPKVGKTGCAPKRCEACERQAKLKSDREAKTRARARPESSEAREQRLQYHRDYRQANAAQWKGYRLAYRLRRYGITEQELAALWNRQQGRCAICEQEMDPAATGRKANECVIDHDHSSGQVRGLLCRQCNIGLGHFENRPGTLEAAVLYLSGNQLGAVTRAAA